MARDPRYEWCGVYAIWCTGDGSIYIGSTSNSFAIRWSQHRMEHLGYRYGQGGNHRLRATFAKFGSESFQFVILEVLPCGNKRLLRRRERFWYRWFRRSWGDGRMLNVVQRIALNH
jgi:hypothetical protein